MREIMDAMSSSHPCTDGVFRKGTQIAGSEGLYNVLAYFIDQVPCPIMLVMPTSDTAKRVSKQRLQPMIEETPALSAKVKEARSRDSGNTLLMKDFPGGVLVIAGANSGPGLRSMPVRVLLQDEIDAYPEDVDNEGDPTRVAEKRTDTFAGRAKRMYTSTPKHKGSSRIDKRYESGTQALYYVPCPHCSEFQPLRWEQMKWEMDESTGELSRVWYECVVCSSELQEHQKSWLLANGRHVHHSPGAGELLADESEHPHAIWIRLATGEIKRFLPRYTKPLSWHVSALYSDLGFTWWKAVAEFLEAQKGGYDEQTGETDLQVFTNTVLGEAYEVLGEQPQDNLLSLRAEPYRLGTAPAEALLLTASVDVQGDRLEVKVKGYGRGEESWLIDYQHIYGDPEQEDIWDELSELRNKEFRRPSGAIMKISFMAVDSGYLTQTVYSYCRRQSRNGIFATKGVQQQGRPLLSQPRAVDLKRSGKIIKHGLLLWTIGTDTAKERIYRRLDLTAKSKIGERIHGAMHFPTGLPDDYYAGLVAEKLIRRRVRGAEVREWVKTRERNEPLDLEVLCYAAAVRAGIQRIDWDALERSMRLADEQAIPPPLEPDEDGMIQTKPASRGLFVARPPGARNRPGQPR